MQASLTEASRALHTSLDGEAYLDEVTIEVPHSWTEMECKTTLSPACLSPSARKVSYLVFVSSDKLTIQSKAKH